MNSIDKTIISVRKSVCQMFIVLRDYKFNVYGHPHGLVPAYKGDNLNDMLLIVLKRNSLQVCGYIAMIFPLFFLKETVLRVTLCFHE